MNASDYQPPRWLRNPHVQSVLGSSALRRIRSRQLLAAAGARTSEHILDGGVGVRLQGWMSVPPGDAPVRGTVLLLHGWKAAPNPTTCGSPPRACSGLATRCSG